MDSHIVNTVFNGGLSFTAEINHHSLLMDSPDEPGQDKGPSPKRLMLASLAGCTGIDVVSILNKMKVNFTDFSIAINASLSDVHPKIYKEVNITYTIRLAEDDRPKMEKAVNLSMEKYCGVSAMFSSFATLTHEIIFL